MPNLFTSGPLEQTTGEISERWNQDGSELKNAAATFTTSAGTILTVTAGKKFYMKTLSFQCTTEQNNTLTDGSGGAVKIYLRSQASSGMYNQTFDTPVEFSTSIYQNSALAIWNFTITGWEE